MQITITLNTAEALTGADRSVLETILGHEAPAPTPTPPKIEAEAKAEAVKAEAAKAEAAKAAKAAKAEAAKAEAAKAEAAKAVKAKAISDLLNPEDIRAALEVEEPEVTDTRTIRDAVDKATALVAAMKGPQVKAALKEIGATRVGLLEGAQIGQFLDALDKLDA